MPLRYPEDWDWEGEPNAEAGTMATPCNPCWGNCALEADPEMLAIDRMEAALGLLPAGARRVRGLISTLEVCHHKADRWVRNVIEAIGEGDTAKRLGSRPPGSRHPAEAVWRNAAAALSAWCAGRPAAEVALCVGDVPASSLLAGLGERSPLKEWQVQRVADKVRSVIHWGDEDDPAAQYEWLLLGVEEGDAEKAPSCPAQYREHEPFWRATARTIIHDARDGEAANLPLALAIDMLWPCHWAFVENLRIVLDAIGGDLRPETPFAACGRNIGMLPIRPRMEAACETLRAFCGDGEPDGAADGELLALLGQPNPVRRWLAASLEKTIRMQLDPPPELRAACALPPPEWVLAQEPGGEGS